MSQRNSTSNSRDPSRRGSVASLPPEPIVVALPSPHRPLFHHLPHFIPGFSRDKHGPASSTGSASPLPPSRAGSRGLSRGSAGESHGYYLEEQVVSPLPLTKHGMAHSYTISPVEAHMLQDSLKEVLGVDLIEPDGQQRSHSALNSNIVNERSIRARMARSLTPEHMQGITHKDILNCSFGGIPRGTDPADFLGWQRRNEIRNMPGATTAEPWHFGKDPVMATHPSGCTYRHGKHQHRLSETYVREFGRTKLYDGRGKQGKHCVGPSLQLPQYEGNTNETSQRRHTRKSRPLGYLHSSVLRSNVVPYLNATPGTKMMMLPLGQNTSTDKLDSLRHSQSTRPEWEISASRTTASPPPKYPRQALSPSRLILKRREENERRADLEISPQGNLKHASAYGDQQRYSGMSPSERHAMHFTSDWQMSTVQLHSRLTYFEPKVNVHA